MESKAGDSIPRVFIGETMPLGMGCVCGGGLSFGGEYLLTSRVHHAGRQENLFTTLLLLFSHHHSRGAGPGKKTPAPATPGSNPQSTHASCTNTFLTRKSGKRDQGDPFIRPFIHHSSIHSCRRSAGSMNARSSVLFCTVRDSECACPRRHTTGTTTTVTLLLSPRAGWG